MVPSGKLNYVCCAIDTLIAVYSCHGELFGPFSFLDINQIVHHGAVMDYGLPRLKQRSGTILRS